MRFPFLFLLMVSCHWPSHALRHAKPNIFLHPGWVQSMVECLLRCLRYVVAVGRKKEREELLNQTTSDKSDKCVFVGWVGLHASLIIC